MIEAKPGGYGVRWGRIGVPLSVLGAVFLHPVGPADAAVLTIRQFPNNHEEICSPPGSDYGFAWCGGIVFPDEFLADPDYRYLFGESGGLWNGFFSFVSDTPFTKLEVLTYSSVPLHQEDPDTIDGAALNGLAQTEDSHFILDPGGTGVAYMVTSASESSVQGRAVVEFAEPITFFAYQVVAFERDTVLDYMTAVEFSVLLDGKEPETIIAIPEPSRALLGLTALASAGWLASRRRRRSPSGAQAHPRRRPERS